MLKEGDMAPDFRLSSQDGREVSLSSLRGKKVVLYFYPKAMTPGCTTESSEFRDAKEEFDKAGAVILGCSADTVASQAKFSAKYDFDFPLLSDPDFHVIEAYDARRMKHILGNAGGLQHRTHAHDRRVALLAEPLRREHGQIVHAVVRARRALAVVKVGDEDAVADDGRAAGDDAFVVHRNGKVDCC